MTVRRITTIVGISSFCLGIWLDRKFREYNESYKMTRFKIFDAVNADDIVTNDQQLITNNEQRISQVRYIYLKKRVLNISPTHCTICFYT